jgi:hypothetical protein
MDKEEDRPAGRRFGELRSEERKRSSGHSPGLNRCQGLQVWFVALEAILQEENISEDTLRYRRKVRGDSVL